jgi:RimJ/RimL family protein N-acetyltransferase
MRGSVVLSSSRLHSCNYAVERPAMNVVETPRLLARELSRDEVPLLQAFFDANPEYFETINGRRAHPDEATSEFDDLPPAHMTFTGRWMLGLFAKDDGARLVGHAGLLSDLCAPGVWHIGLYVLASDRHGHGDAGPMLQALEDWMVGGGARWIRLGVVAGNAKAERFWDKHGYREVRRREGVDTGGRVNDLRVMVKSMQGEPIERYLALVPRDAPGSTLP